MKTYTFHVSIPRTGRTWRKLELSGKQTLTDLHLAIQEAFEFDNDHLYSFFMSGKAWDRMTEYTLPDDVSPWEGLPPENAAPNDTEKQALPEAGEPLHLSEEDLDKIIREEAESMDIPADMLRSMLEFYQQYMDEETKIQTERDVRSVTLDSLHLSVGQEFLYLFDYGDEWRFKVRVHAINPTAAEGDYPRIVEKVGDPPEQYPMWDDDDDDMWFIDESDLLDLEDFAEKPPENIIQFPVGSALTPEYKQQITERCNEFVEKKLKPRHVIPENANPNFGYKVDLFTHWHGRYFYFCSRYRNPRPNATEEFYEVKFNRLKYVGSGRFDLAYMRHTGKWQPVYENLMLNECLKLIETEEIFWP